MALLFAVGSANPVKLNCVRDAVAEFWPDAGVEGVATESGVAAQPFSEAEMSQGASNRARQALERVGAATYGVGLEGGVVDSQQGLWAFAWVTIADRQGRLGHGQTGRFLLPEGVARLLWEEGLELGEADDRFFGASNSKHNQGAIGLLTGGRIDRRALYRPAVTFALLRFLHPEFYDP